MAMPVMIAALLQPGAVVLVKEVLQAASARGALPPSANAATELDASSSPTPRWPTRTRMPTTRPDAKQASRAPPDETTRPACHEEAR